MELITDTPEWAEEQERPLVVQVAETLESWREQIPDFDDMCVVVAEFTQIKIDSATHPE